MVDFSDISPHLHVKLSPKAKRLALRLDPRTRRVNLVIPPRASLKKAYEFAEQNKGWIAAKINDLPEPIPYTHGTILPLFGIPCTLRIENGDSKITRITHTATDMVITTQREDIAPRISRHIKSLAASELEKRCRAKAREINKNLAAVTVRDTKSRWGSCSIDGRITLSWRLIFASPEAIDYVISHEVAHLIHPNHGMAFWDLCEKLSLNFTAGRHWMRENGSLLARYGESVLPPPDSL